MDCNIVNAGQRRPHSRGHPLPPPSKCIQCHTTGWPSAV